MIEEDYERLSLTDQIYLAEYQQEIENEYRQWEEEENKLPAKITVLNPIKKEEFK